MQLLKVLTYGIIFLNQKVIFVFLLLFFFFLLFKDDSIEYNTLKSEKNNHYKKQVEEPPTVWRDMCHWWGYCHILRVVMAYLVRIWITHHGLSGSSVFH
jgi:hypothetical protein